MIQTMVTAPAVFAVLAGALVMKGGSVSEEKLKERAAFALGVSPDAVAVSHQNREGIRINFVATADKYIKYCYVTSADGGISNAVCSGTESSKTETPGSDATHTDTAPKNISQIE